MSTVDLLQPILEGGLQRNNFFNGRLLSAEDLRAEQAAATKALGLVARAVGDGVGWGLEVSVASTGPDRPRVSIAPGVALNRLGNVLHLPEPADVALVPATGAGETAVGLFADCEPPRPTGMLTGNGAYVLAIAPTSGYQGTALVSDPNTTALGRGACGARFNVEGVRFRLVAIPIAQIAGIGDALRAQVIALLPPGAVPARERLRNLLAHLCLGTQALGFGDAARKTAEPPVQPRWGLLDAMRARGELTDCDVPLAIVVLTTQGISFVDMWSARRRLIDAAAIEAWKSVAGPRRVSEAEAGFLQFQSQLAGVRAASAAAAVSASTYFDVLPPAGWLPAGSGGFTWTTFLGPHAPPAVTPVDAALLRGILERSWFDEPFALATTPPVPVRVFEVPEQAAGEPFVVFARSSSGSIRVLLTPPPGPGETVEVTAVAATGRMTRATTRTNGIVPVVELAPGLHRVTVEAPDYVAIPPQEATAVGGRTVDLSVTLTPLPNGSILVDAIDRRTTERIGRAVESITASDGVTTRAGRFEPSTGLWLIADLPPSTYVLTGIARGFETATKSGVGPTVRGQTLDAQLVFDARKRETKEPPRCVDVRESERPKLRSVHLCLVLSATEFDEKYFYRERELEERGSRLPSGRFRMSKRREARRQRESERYSTGTGEIVYTRPPWERMVELRPQLPDVKEWLLQWRAWFAVELDDRRIEAFDPIVYIDPGYRPARNARDLAAAPPAYAVFGRFAVPLAIKPAEARTRAPVRIREEHLPGVREDLLRDLYEVDIRYIDDLAWAWGELIVDATGEPFDRIRYLVTDAAAAIKKINENREYLAGADRNTNKILTDLGIRDDVGLANADEEKLGDKLGSRGFAVRLIQQARRIVSADSWSLDGLGLSTEQVEALAERGIDSKGALAAGAGRADGRTAIAEALGIDGEPAASRDTAITALANDAVLVMARSSLALTPLATLATWERVDSLTAARLTAAGFATVEDLAAADPDEVATAANVSFAAAKKLVADAGGASRASLAIGALAPVSRAEEKSLKDLLGATRATVGTIASKTPDEIAAAFDGDVARATAVLNGIRAGLAAGRIR